MAGSETAVDDNRTPKRRGGGNAYPDARWKGSFAEWANAQKTGSKCSLVVSHVYARDC